MFSNQAETDVSSLLALLLKAEVAVPGGCEKFALQGFSVAAYVRN
jgi:hypothetical protein